MATLRAVIHEAMRALRATAPGEDPTADELAVGLEAAQALIGEIHEARGPMISRDIGQSVTAGENQRLRIQAGASVDVTLPNAVSSLSAFGPQDPGAAALAGTTGSADGRTWRAPDDGARIEIVGTTTALYFYRDDINAWSPATGLTLESESPFNSRLTGAFAALVAERLCDVVSSGPPTPMLQRRIGRARLALASRVGAPRRETVGQYF